MREAARGHGCLRKVLDTSCVDSEVVAFDLSPGEICLIGWLHKHRVLLFGSPV